MPELGIETLQQLVNDLALQCNAWQRIVKGKDRLLIAYRLGGRPPESAFNDIERGKKVLRKFGVEI